MAYMPQSLKAKLAVGIKEVMKKHGFKGTIGVRNHSTLVINVSAGPVDIKPLVSYSMDYIQVNPHYLDKYAAVPKLVPFLKELVKVANVDNHDNSDYQTDYFDVGYYLDINLGRYDKPYVQL